MKAKGLYQFAASSVFFLLLYFVFFLTDGLRLAAALLFICFETMRIIVETIIQRYQKPGNANHVNNSHYVNKDNNTFVKISISIYSFILLLLIDYLFINSTASILPVILGIAIFSIGFAVRIMSFSRLKNYFNKKVVIYKEHRIIKDGIYKIIRHPLYFGMLLIYAGYAAILCSVLGLIFLLFIVTPAYINRIHAEEEALLDRFGDEYKLYMESTKRIIPFIW
jgi:protein-S-isoprenylcysteine O-methyltransferase Ste14